jgi:hypothetical protein
MIIPGMFRSVRPRKPAYRSNPTPAARRLASYASRSRACGRLTHARRTQTLELLRSHGHQHSGPCGHRRVATYSQEFKDESSRCTAPRAGRSWRLVEVLLLHRHTRSVDVVEGLGSALAVGAVRAHVVAVEVAGPLLERK